VELIYLMLRFKIFFLKIFDEVTFPIHLHPLHAFPYDVYHEPSGLCGVVLSDDIANYELAIEVHYTIQDRGYLFYFIICLLYACARERSGPCMLNPMIKWINA
jgi:hypothetical protein